MEHVLESDARAAWNLAMRRVPSAEGRLQIALRDLFEIIERIDIRQMVGERTAVRVKEQARAALRGEP